MGVGLIAWYGVYVLVVVALLFVWLLTGGMQKGAPLELRGRKDSPKRGCTIIGLNRHPMEMQGTDERV